MLLPAATFSAMETHAREKDDQERAGAADVVAHVLNEIADLLAQWAVEDNYEAPRKKAQGLARRGGKKDTR